MARLSVYSTYFLEGAQRGFGASMSCFVVMNGRPAGYLAIYPIHEARQYLVGVREEGHIGVRDRPRARAVNYYVHTIPTLKVTQKGHVRGGVSTFQNSTIFNFSTNSTRKIL